VVMENERFSKTKQWHERSERPIAARPMTKEQIVEFQSYLAMSYKCRPDDITYEFEKIFDEKDEDRDDCLWLKYKMNTIWQGKPTMRIIYTIKLPIPEDLKMRAEQMRRQEKEDRKMKRGGAPPSHAQPQVSTVIIEEVTEEDESSQRPKLRKPMRRQNA
jgi:hypothetical protein